MTCSIITYFRLVTELCLMVTKPPTCLNRASQNKASRQLATPLKAIYPRWMTEHGETDCCASISFGKLLLQSGKSVTKSTKSLRTANEPFIHMPQRTATRAWNFSMEKHVTKRVVMPGLADLQDRLCTYSAPRKQGSRLRNKHVTAFVELKLLADIKCLFSNATSLGNWQEHKERLFPCSHIENASLGTGLHKL